MNAPDHGFRITTAALPPLARFRFLFTALEPIRLPEYAGSAWRGLLGHGLRRTACVTRQPTCEGCLLVHGCVYAQIFETPPPPGFPLNGFSAVPHPYALVIDPRAPRDYAPGETLTLGITLIGPAIAQVPYLIHALALAGERGIGSDPGRFRLDGVEREGAPGSDQWGSVYRADEGDYQQLAAEPAVPPPAPESLRLHLITPLRIKRDSRFLSAADFTPADLVHHLDVRLMRLARLYGGDPSAFDWDRDAVLARALQAPERRLSWHDWTRYSSRQRTHMQMGGLIGDLVLSGSGLAPLWPALWAGQWTQVGKGTAFGLGRYRIESDPTDLDRASGPDHPA